MVLFDMVLSGSMKWLEIEEPVELSDDQLETAMAVFLVHAIKKILKRYTSHIYREAVNLDIEIDAQYASLGSLFQNNL